MRNTPLQLKYDKQGLIVAEALKERHFEAYYCATKEEALKTAINLIPKDDVISWGGSLSIEQIGLQRYVKENGYRCIDRDDAQNVEERIEKMRQGLLSDTFLMSANAISEDGQLVNIDGNGNRLAAMMFGPKNVIVVAGMNKIVKSADDAMCRVRTVAAPLIVQRFPDAKTPCNVTGCCADCKGYDSCCTYLVTTRMCRPARRIKVILVGEDLGL